MSTIVFDPYEKVPVGAFLPKIAYTLTTEDGGFDEDAAASYVVDTVIDFANRTRALRREIRIRLQPCVDTYRVDTQDCVELVALLRACYEGYSAIIVPREQCGRGCGVACGPVTVSIDDDGILHISPPPPPDATDTFIDLTVAVAPKRDACEVDAMVYTKYAQLIVAGTLSELYKISAAPWFNMSLAQMREAEYNRRVASAGVDRILGRATGPFKMRGMKII